MKEYSSVLSMEGSLVVIFQMNSSFHVQSILPGQNLFEQVLEKKRNSCHDELYPVLNNRFLSGFKPNISHVLQNKY